jgi:ribosomal 50S subunit-recycling heat shock protein
VSAARYDHLGYRTTTAADRAKYVRKSELRPPRRSLSRTSALLVPWPGKAWILPAPRSQCSVGVAGEQLSVRVDSWIWSVRLTKTRSIASDACRGGHIRINEMWVKPTHAVRTRDEVRLQREGRERIVNVSRTITKRVGTARSRRVLRQQEPSAPSSRGDLDGGHPGSWQGPSQQMRTPQHRQAARTLDGGGGQRRPARLE